MFAIIVSDGVREFFFAGWEGTDSHPYSGEMSYWRPTLSDPETYEFDDKFELKIELKLLMETDLSCAIGLPDDFDVNSAILAIEQVRPDHYERS